MHDNMQLLAKFKKIQYMGFRATLHTLENFINFAKSCVLSCLLKVDNIKKFHRAVFEL